MTSYKPEYIRHRIEWRYTGHGPKKKQGIAFCFYILSCPLNKSISPSPSRKPPLFCVIEELVDDKVKDLVSMAEGSVCDSESINLLLEALQQVAGEQSMKLAARVRTFAQEQVKKISSNDMLHMMKHAAVGQIDVEKMAGCHRRLGALPQDCQEQVDKFLSVGLHDLLKKASCPSASCCSCTHVQCGRAARQQSSSPTSQPLRNTRSCCATLRSRGLVEKKRTLQEAGVAGKVSSQPQGPSLT